VEDKAEIGAMREYFTDECEKTFDEETVLEGEDFSGTDFDSWTEGECARELDFVEVNALALIFPVAEDFLDSELEIWIAETFDTATLLDEIFRVSWLDERGTVSGEEWRRVLVDASFEM
jgi:hypothetical protein